MEKKKKSFLLMLLLGFNVSVFAQNGFNSQTCEKITQSDLPIYCDFEDNAPLNCWNLVKTASLDLFDQTFTWPYVTNETGYLSAHSFLFTFMPLMVATPMIDGSIEGLCLSFMAKGESVTDTCFEIGTLDDIYDTSTYTHISYLDLETQFKKFVFNFDSLNVSLNGKYLALKFNGNITVQNTQMFVDDFMLYQYSDCTPVDMYSVNVSNITEHTADISFNDSNEDHYNWVVYYKKSDDDTAYDSVITDEQFVTLTDLDAETSYNIYIKADCYDMLSSPTVIQQFFTLCEPLGEESLPLVQGFENGFPQCWNIVQSVEIYGGEYYPNITSYSNGYTGNYAMTFSDGVCVLATPKLDVDIEQLKMTFYHLNQFGQQTGVLQVGVMSDIDDISTFKSVYTVGDSGLDWGFDIVSFENSEIKGKGNYIAFHFTASESEISIGQFHIDDITIDFLPGCTSPEANSVNISAITSTSAQISFTDNSPEHDTWIVYWRSSRDSVWESATVNEQSLTLNDLQPSSSYAVYVRTECNNDNLKYDSTIIKYFYTKSEETINSFPYYQDFEQKTTDATWDFYSLSDNRWVVGSANGTEDENGVHSLYISDDNGLSNEYKTNKLSFAMAALNVKFEDDKQYLLAFDYNTNGEGTLENPFDWFAVYLADKDFDISNFMNFSSLSSPLLNKTVFSDGWKEFSCILNNVENSEKKIIFMWFNNNLSGNQTPAAIDNISIKTIDCPQPEITEITPDNSSVTLTWSETEAEAYLLKLDKDGEIVETTDTSYTFKGLTFNNTYTAYLGSVCNSEDTLWQTVIFTAKVPCQTIITTLTPTICEGEAFNYNGFEITEQDEYSFGYQTSEGCDSIVTINLTVLPIYQDTTQVTVCSNEPYEFNGTLYDKSGTYTQTNSSQNGCDSVNVLILTVNDAFDTVIYVSQTDNPLLNEGDTINQEILSTLDGCDSVVTYIFSTSSLVNSEYNTEIALFPNPANDKITISNVVCSTDYVVFEIYDNNGRLATEETKPNAAFYTLNTALLKSGAYIVKVKYNSGKVFSKTFIKN